MKKATVIGLCVAVPSLAGLLSFCSVPHCCGSDDDSQKAFEQTLGLAIAGDAVAAESLYKDYASGGRLEQARYWALIGAINGSPTLIEEYQSIRRRTPGTDTSGEDSIIRKNLRMRGATLLAGIFHIDPSASK